MSFIKKQRREQIIKACIEELASKGYQHMTFKNIAERIDANPSLVSYHFVSKDALLFELLGYILEHKTHFIENEIKSESSVKEQLRTFIEVSLDYHRTHRKENISLIEILFNMRTEEGEALYLLDDDEPDPVHELFMNIIKRGIETGEFNRSVDIEVLNTIVNGAIDERMLFNNGSQTNKEFTKVLLGMIHHYVHTGGENCVSK